MFQEWRRLFPFSASVCIRGSTLDRNASLIIFQTRMTKHDKGRYPVEHLDELEGLKRSKPVSG